MVKLIRTTRELELTRAEEKRPVGFVPTMGNLHEGHISLLGKALSEFEVVYFSIFVNPKQFGPKDDFHRYPRTLENDVLLIEKAARNFPNSQIVVYSPKDPDEVFPTGYDQTISVTGVTEMLEGSLRPGHFDGVATVVYRLFELVKPATAYFGLKDFQQYLVIKKMVKDLLLPIKITGMPIIREESGLALSSRNQYLSPDEKKASLVISKTLKELNSLISGQKDNLPKARAFIKEVTLDKNWNYLELRDGETLSEDLSHSNLITILAVYQLGATRLLDNMQVELK